MIRKFLLCLVPLLLWGAAAASECAPNRLALSGNWGTANFNIELAQTPEERRQGLMHRESMPRNAGMLFIFDPPQQVHFWMRNTLIPLDMIFVDRSGVVRRVHSNAVPHDETGIPGIPQTYGVLEINGGLADVLGIGPGTRLQHPAFGDAAVWPCP